MGHAKIRFIQHNLALNWQDEVNIFSQYLFLILTPIINPTRNINTTQPKSKPNKQLYETYYYLANCICDTKFLQHSFRSLNCLQVENNDADNEGVV